MDTFGCKSSIRISKKQLPAAKKIEANFNFFKIKSLTFLIGEGNYTSEIFAIHNEGNIITANTKKYFEKISINKIVPITVIANGINKDGLKIEWGNLYIVIKG